MTDLLQSYFVAFLILGMILLISRRYLDRYGLGGLVPRPRRLARALLSWLVSREPSRTIRSRSRILPRPRDHD